jgi:hypothetical protein
VSFTIDIINVAYILFLQKMLTKYFDSLTSIEPPYTFTSIEVIIYRALYYVLKNMFQQE